MSGLSGPAQISELKDSLSDVIWGVKTDSLSSDDAKSYLEDGAGLLAFHLKGTSIGAVSSEDSAKVLVIDPAADVEDLRDINSLPVDAVLFPLAGASSSWTLDNQSQPGAAYAKCRPPPIRAQYPVLLSLFTGIHPPNSGMTHVIRA